MKGELWWRGENSTSKFDHHNINGGAVTVHDVTGRRLVRSIYRAHEISMVVPRKGERSIWDSVHYSKLSFYIYSN
jgi:hypothetical protein